MHVLRRDSHSEDLFTAVGSTPEMAYVEDPLDDVFGSDTEPPHEEVAGAEPRETHPSDMRRLQTEHSTAGYRDGITAAKAQSIQVGFDEGFSLGGTIGLKAGQLLGYLEGIAGALRASSNGSTGDEPNHEPASALLARAQTELAAETVFGEQFWNSDGTWNYEIASNTSEQHDDNIIFEDVANAHPAITKWTRIVGDLLDQHSINKTLLDVTEETPQNNGPARKEIKVDQQSREVLDW
ncbi:ABC1 domain containing protein [Apiospora marii]|uniref:Protein YAE1 n=1 Tax=Apiospora marii TaxID=335849 RepID=A0ABR1T1Z4_9PEZI